jgi:two-component system NtrC family sensor kinase
MVSNIRVLCVDDDQGVVKSLRRLLQKIDVEVLTALSGDEGLRLLRDTGPAHVLIADYRMPGMNGVELLKEVGRRWPQTVRLMLSGHTDSSVFTAAVLDGRIFRFLTKPWNDDEVLAVVSHAVDRFWLLRENDLMKQELELKDAELRKLKKELGRPKAVKVERPGGAAGTVTAPPTSA